MLQNDTNFTGKWIRTLWSPVCLLRKSFTLNKRVLHARLSVSALGVCEPRLNGKKVGDAKLLPGWTDYRKRVYYHSFDVSELLCVGENTLGAILAPGWFAGYYGPFGDKGYYGRDAWFAGQLDLEYDDGTRERIISDRTWAGQNNTPWTDADLLMGESYDARKETHSWDAPGFDDKHWHPVRLIDNEDVTPEKVEPFPGIAIKTVQTLQTVTVTEPQPGVYIFDLGQNMVGVARLKINVPNGTEVILRHAEMLHADGSIYTGNLRSVKATDRYIAKGGGEELWQPIFTFHGFRYVEVSGLPERPSLNTIVGQVWMSALDETCSFECSNSKVNQLFSNIRWGFRGNYLDVPTDCPQRDERLGWTGDAHIFIRSATYLADIRPFFRKWLVDLNDAQHSNGGYPDVAPFMGRINYASAGWADAGIICPYVMWQTYADLDFVRPWWQQMKQYMSHIFSEGNRHNSPHIDCYGDWLSFGTETPVELIGLAYRAYDTRLMIEMAEALGESKDAQLYRDLEVQARTSFRVSFFNTDGVAVQTQTACALAIGLELLDGADLEAAEQCLIACLESNNGYLTTGFIGTAYLCPALTKAGRPDLAIKLLLNEEHPSWLYEVNNGATTVWERWNSWTEEDGFGDEGMNSFNHYAFGSILEWLLQSFAGIKSGGLGYEQLDFAPCLDDSFDFLKASFASPKGQISVHWKKTDAGFEVNLQTPVPAQISLPLTTEIVKAGSHTFLVTS